MVRRVRIEYEMSQWNAWIQNHYHEIDQELNAVKRVREYESEEEEQMLKVSYKVQPHDSLTNLYARLVIDGVDDERLEKLVDEIEKQLKNYGIYLIDPKDLVDLVNDCDYEIDAYKIQSSELEAKAEIQAF